MSFVKTHKLHPTGAPFLPLAFRFAISFGLFVLHLALPQDHGHLPAHEGVYLTLLALLFVESAWESSRSLAKNHLPFATPSKGWIRFNLLLDIVLVAWVIAFQGVDQERFATIYLFPVLASAFYLETVEIVVVGVLSATAHVTTVLLFSTGILPPFGYSTTDLAATPSHYSFILGFATLQIFACTLVVVLIRRHLDHLRSHLSQSQATVDELSNLYRHVVESMFSGLITSNLDGVITSANPAASWILQRPVTAGLPVEDLGIIDLILASSQPKEQRFEQRFITGDGRWRTLGGNVAPLKDGSGHQTGYLVLFQDLTDLKALEERNRLQEKLAIMGELSAELAHELRNPMASIQGCVQILQNNVKTVAEPTNPIFDRVLTILQRESERVSTLITHFLDFAKPRPGEPVPLSLRKLVEDIRGAFEMDARNGALRFDIGEVPDVSVLADDLFAHQVFSNLLSNARKALQRCDDPHIYLHFLHEGAWVKAQLKDNGCGMNPTQLNEVFSPFVSGFEEGTGLGMSLVYQFTQRMGWEMDIQSESGLGTTITLSMPIVAL